MEKQSIEPRILNCVECNSQFEFGGGEAAYFYSKGLSEPKRCPKCREDRKRLLRLSKAAMVEEVDRG